VNMALTRSRRRILGTSRRHGFVFSFADTTRAHSHTHTYTFIYTFISGVTNKGISHSPRSEQVLSCPRPLHAQSDPEYLGLPVYISHCISILSAYISIFTHTHVYMQYVHTLTIYTHSRIYALRTNTDTCVCARAHTHHSRGVGSR